MRWHLDWKFSLVVSTWSHDELLKLVLRFKLVLVVLELNDKEVISLAHSSFIYQGNWAVTKDSLLLCGNLCSLVVLESDWDTLAGREDHIVDESSWVGNEHISFSLTLEVVEHVVEVDTQLWVVSASNQLLLVLPGYWAEVVELRQVILEDASVVVGVLHQAWLFVVKVGREALSCMNISLDGANGSIFHVPDTLGSIDFCEVVIDSVVEAKNMRKIMFKMSKSVSNDRSVALKCSYRVSLSSGIDVFLWHSNIENIGWLKVSSGQVHSLFSGLWIVFKNPTVLKAVFLLSSLKDEISKESFINSLSVLLHELSQLFAFNAVSVNILLNNIFNLKMNCTS